jgi:hypothetical protein
MDEAPDGSIVHLETKAGKFCYKTTQGELPLRDPLAKKDGMRADQKPPPVAAHLTGRSAPRRPKSLRPFHHARRAEAQRLSNHTHALARLNPRNSALTQIHRIGSRHPPKASDSNTTFESETRQFGNPHRFS